MLTDKLREQISALVDDELPADEHELLARRFSLEKYLCICWERYHLIGEAMRKALPQVDTRGFSDRIMKALELEHDADVANSRENKLISYFSRTAAGMSVAACVAVVAIFGLRYDEMRVQSVSTPSEIVPHVSSVQVQPISDSMLNKASWNGNAPEVQAELTNYIINHNESATVLEQQGMLPYFYLTSHSQGGRASQSLQILQPPGQQNKQR